jgi:1-acyl-sn-glycerol-3-phosphate acyltransferase
MSHYLFDGMDSYDTPESNRCSLAFHLWLHSRWYFYQSNFMTFILCGNTASHGKLDKEGQIMYSSRNIRLIERCGGRIHIRGLNHLRDLGGKPVVIVGNHMSLLETAVLHAIIREHIDFSFVVKKSLLDVPFFRHILLSFHAIPVGRTNAREDLKTVLTEGKKMLESGISMIVFPQSTRTDTFDPSQFNTIGIKLAKSAGVPVLPMALKTDFLSTGKYLRDLGPLHPERAVRFEFGPPMEVAQNSHETHQKTIDFIQGCFDRWSEEDKVAKK